ncbi:MAG: adenylate/guanylate cyclase domain-containing protein [Ilumatobacteraceae bacterium]|nr:adenylate/guanylate cyclase domain-containing protein [Ilumatobacteraceae bacterium]
MATALLAVSLFGTLNFFAASQLLREGTEDQVASVAQARARTIEASTGNLLAEVSAMAADLGVTTALEDFISAYDELQTQPLDPEQLATLDESYATEVIEPLNAAGLGPVTVEELRPASTAGQYVQYHYSLSPKDEDGRSQPPTDAGDGSTYSEVNSEYSEFLSTLAESVGQGDLMLISADTGEVVYTVDKQIDVGTNLLDGPYDESALAIAARDRLPNVKAGEALLTNFDIYIPGGGKPVLFALATVRSGSEVIGVLALEVPVEALNGITTADGNWEEVGLGSGESYVVAADLVLQSESRLWIEDPEKYLRDVDEPELADFIEAFDSPVGIQIVDTVAVQEALDEGSFVGSTKNYLGQETFTSSNEISIPGVQWVVVTDVPLTDVSDPLYDYLWKIALVLLLVLPASAAVGFWLAKRLTKPIAPAVEAALAVAEGERDPDLPPLGNDEFGDLGRRLRRMAAELGKQEAALAQEYEDTRQLMMAVLPPHLVESTGELTGTGAGADVATVVAISVDTGKSGPETDDSELVESLATVAQFAEDLAAENSMERVRVAADRYLFLAGAGHDDDGAANALEFSAALATKVRSFNETSDHHFTLHVGLSTGAVATGVLGSGALTFGAWGDPVRRALAIGALSKGEEILVDSSTAAAASDSWVMNSANHIVDLNDEPMRLFTLQLETAT